MEETSTPAGSRGWGRIEGVLWNRGEIALEIICPAVPHLVLLRSGEGESKPGLRAGGEEKGRGVVARQVSGEHVFERSLAMRNMMLMVRNMMLMMRNMMLMMRNVLLMMKNMLLMMRNMLSMIMWTLPCLCLNVECRNLIMCWEQITDPFG